MNDLDLLQKKTGMTFMKGLGLMIFALFSAFFLVIIYGFLAKYIFHKFNKDIVLDYWMLVLVITNSIAIYLGIRLVNKELPYFQIPKPTAIIITILLCVFTFIPESFISHTFLISEKENIKSSIFEFGLECILTFLLFFLQIGVIGHGFLKKYDFPQATTFTLFLSFCFMYPGSILIAILHGLLLLLIYKKTRSYFLILLNNFLVIIVDFIIWTTNNSINSISNYDYVRKNLLLSDFSYYISLIISFVGILIFTFILLKTKSNYIWQKQPEYEPLNF